MTNHIRARKLLVQAFPLIRDAAVRSYFRQAMNWFFFLFAAALFAVAWPLLHLTHHLSPQLLPVFAAFATVPVALAWQRPGVGWIISALTAFITWLSVDTVHGWSIALPIPQIIALFVLTFMTLARTRIRQAPVFAIATVLLAVVVAPSDAATGWAVTITTWSTVIIALRVATRFRRGAAEQAHIADIAQAQTAVLAERTRIARELHDVVAHRMSMVVVAAQTAQYRIDDVSAGAQAEFTAIAASARAALDEVRGLLNVLRVDDAQAARAPVPTFDDIAGIVESARAAGVVVTVALIESGDVAPDDAVGLSAYRIVAESFANAVRHAPGSVIEGSIVRGTEGVAIDIVNDCSASAAVSPSTVGGHGLSGMRERAKAVGGSVDAGVRDGRFYVKAQLPLRSGAADDDGAITQEQG